MAVFQDLSGRAASITTLRWRGLITALVLALVGILFYMDSTGQFSKPFKIKIEATSIGEGLAEGADVKYRGLRIGSVESINTRSYRHQVIELSLDPNQAGGLRGITSAKYQSSNIFGAPGIELLSGTGQEPLREGAVVKIDSSGKVASITSALRQIASLTTLLGTDKVQRLLRIITQNGDLAGPFLHGFFTLGRLYADNLRKPVVNLIQDATPIANGLGLVIGPLIQVLEDFYDHSEFLGHPDTRDATVETLHSATATLGDELGNTLENINPDGVDSLGFLIDIGHPLFMSGASAASAWGNLETFINRVEDAMPMIDGKVKLRLEVLLPASRALPQSDDSDDQSSRAGQRQLTPEQQRQVQELQTQILGAPPQVRALVPGQTLSQQMQQQAQSQEQAPQQQAPQQPGGDFASIPNQQHEGGIR